MKRAPKPPPLPPIGDHAERMHYQPLVGSEVRQWIAEQAHERRCSASVIVAHLIEVGHGALQWWQDGNGQPEPMELEDATFQDRFKAARRESGDNMPMAKEARR